MYLFKIYLENSMKEIRIFLHLLEEKTHLDFTLLSMENMIGVIVMGIFFSHLQWNWLDLCCYNIFLVKFNVINKLIRRMGLKEKKRACSVKVIR